MKRQVKLKMRRREQANLKALADLQKAVDRLRDHNRRLQDQMTALHSDNYRLRRMVRAYEEGSVSCTGSLA